MFEKIKNDLPASIVVFLVALPLCLGIALASGAPLIAGLISGILGGILIGFISGSHTGIAGPSASLATVIFAAIQELGSFETFLLAVVIAGVFQMIMGVLRMGIIADYLPSNIIKGLLAAIGLLLIMNQVPYALGINGMQAELRSLLFNGELFKPGVFNQMFAGFSYGPLIISSISILIVVFWDKTPLRKFKFFPSFLFVVIIGTVLAQILNLNGESFSFQKDDMVFIPKIKSVASFFTFPNFSEIGNYNVWVTAFTVAVIGAIATLLNTEAGDNIDPHKRRTPPNRELLAYGIGNSIAGMIGGLPHASLIVRTSVSINAGGETKMVTILHGLLLLLSVFFLSTFINLIPLSCLAAILLITGYKLASVDLFMQMYRKGWNQLIPFVATVTAIIVTDVLIGVMIGSAVSVFFLLKSNYHNPFFLENTKIYSGETIRLELSNEVSFLNKAAIRLTLWEIAPDSKVIIDATYSNFIDQDILELIEDYRNTFAREHNIDLSVIGLREKYDETAHIEYISALDIPGKKNLNYSEILKLLKVGNQRFIASKLADRTSSHQMNAVARGQDPIALIVSSINSGTSTTLLFDANVGDLMTMRLMGNIMNEDIVSGIELACIQMNVKLVVVLGHSNCLATHGAIKSIRTGDENHMTHEIKEYFEKQNIDVSELNPHDKTVLNDAIHKNTKISTERMIQQSNYLQKSLKKDEIGIISAFHDNDTGEVIFDDWYDLK